MIPKKAEELLVTTTVFISLASVVVALRFYVRGLIVHKIGIEDWLALGTLFLSIAQTVTVYYQVHYGLGRHTSTLTQFEGLMQQKVLFISILFYVFALVLIKFSILFQYLRLFVKRQEKLKVWILMGVVGIFGIFIFTTSIVTCVPVARFWDLTIPGHCLTRRPLWLTHAIFNLCTDLAVLLLPMPTLWGLQLPKKQKATLMAIFGLGGLVCIASLIRIPTIDFATITTDPSFDAVPAAVLSSVEVNTAIICASLPMLRPLAGRLFPNLWGSSQRTTPHSKNHHQNHNQNSTYRSNTTTAASIAKFPTTGSSSIKMQSLNRSGTVTTVTTVESAGGGVSTGGGGGGGFFDYKMGMRSLSAFSMRSEGSAKDRDGKDRDDKGSGNQEIVMMTEIVQDVERGPDRHGGDDDGDSVKGLIIQSNRF